MQIIFNNEFWRELIQQIQNWLINEAPGILVLVILFFIAFKTAGFAVTRSKNTLIKRAEKNTKADTDETVKRITTVISIVHGMIRIALWALFAMLLLPKLGVNIGPILASVGIIGLALGFGAQELVRDFISGFFIILENQVRTGDVAVINGTGGLVEKIELRTITLRDFSGVIHIFQNGKINSLSNMTKEWSAMVFDIGVAYKENPQQVMDIMKQEGDKLQADPEFKDNIVEPIEIFGVDNFADSAVVIKARIKTKPIQQWTIGREYRKRLKTAFDKNNIEIPFPHTTIYWGEKIKPLQINTNKENTAP
jgi:moderate conductance mechanosensitive channel